MRTCLQLLEYIRLLNRKQALSIAPFITLSLLVKLIVRLIQLFSFFGIMLEKIFYFLAERRQVLCFTFKKWKHDFTQFSMITCLAFFSKDWVFVMSHTKDLLWKALCKVTKSIHLTDLYYIQLQQFQLTQAYCALQIQPTMCTLTVFVPEPEVTFIRNQNDISVYALLMF